MDYYRGRMEAGKPVRRLFKLSKKKLILAWIQQITVGKRAYGFKSYQRGKTNNTVLCACVQEGQKWGACRVNHIRLIIYLSCLKHQILSSCWSDICLYIRKQVWLEDKLGS